MTNQSMLVSNISDNTPTNLADVIKDFDNLKKFSKLVNTLSDEDVGEFNKKFYTFLNDVRQLADQYNFDVNDAVAYYKLKIWLKAMESITD